MDPKQSRTIKNLIAAFAGESQARNRYTMYAKIAREEGFRLIEEIFLETADNERIHARLFYDQLVEQVNGSMQQVDAEFPVDRGETAYNLQAAAAGEHAEWSELYPGAAAIADEEGFPAVARVYRNIARVEEKHEERYLKLLDQVKGGTFFKKPQPVAWKCRVCGYICESPVAPGKCPVCDHPQSVFELHCERY